MLLSLPDPLQCTIWAGLGWGWDKLYKLGIMFVQTVEADRLIG